MERVHLYPQGSVSLGGGREGAEANLSFGWIDSRCFKKAIGRENVTRERLLSVFKAVCFCPQSLDVSLRKMTLQLEELLLLKLLQFFGYVQQDDDITGSNEEEDECLYATQRYFSPPFFLIH